MKNVLCWVLLLFPVLTYSNLPCSLLHKKRSPSSGPAVAFACWSAGSASAAQQPGPPSRPEVGEDLFGSFWTTFGWLSKGKAKGKPATGHLSGWCFKHRPGNMYCV